MGNLLFCKYKGVYYVYYLGMNIRGKNTQLLNFKNKQFITNNLSK